MRNWLSLTWSKPRQVSKRILIVSPIQVADNTPGHDKTNGVTMKYFPFYPLVLLSLLTTPVLEAAEIHDAVRQGNLETVVQLIQTDPSLVNQRMERGYSPLHWAVNRNDTAITRYLVDHGADLEAKDADGDTPLHWTAYYNRLANCRILVSAGADLNSLNNLEVTPLLAAIESANSAVARLLIQAGPGLNLTQFDDLSTFRAVFAGFIELVENRLATGEVDMLSRGPEGITLLHAAARSDTDALLNLLLDKGAPINEQDDFGLTALHYAALWNRPETIVLLVDRGADINLRDFAGRTALQTAWENDILGVAYLLLELGAENEDFEFDYTGKYFGLKTPGLQPKLFAPGFISTPNQVEFGGTFSPDGKEFFFTRRRFGPDQRVWYTEQEGDGSWSSPGTATFAFDAAEYEPCFTKDGKKIYFGSQRPLPGESANNQTYDIWVSEKTPDGWSEARHVGGDMMYVSIGGDGTMYVTQLNRPDPDVPVTIARRLLQDDASFGPFEALGDSINYLVNAAHPEISPDGTYLLFDGREPGAEGATADLYVSFLRNDGIWSKGIRLPDQVNTPDAGEIAARISPDGKYLFYGSFNRTMGGNYGNIYWVSTKVIERLRPVAAQRKVGIWQRLFKGR
ncbi:ankyrin repeat domain-containing protein [Candidatus Neomarinimicrobiota bacterium]